jgi:hypothetical protein
VIGEAGECCNAGDIPQPGGEVVWSGDQEVVEAFPAQGADEAFRTAPNDMICHPTGLPSRSAHST